MPSWRARERAISGGAGSSTPGAHSISVIGEGQQGVDRSKQAKQTVGELTACPSQMGQRLLSSWGTPDIVRPSKILEDAGNPSFCVKTLDF